MKNLLLIIGIAWLLISCEKEQYNDNLSLSNYTKIQGLWVNKTDNSEMSIYPAMFGMRNDTINLTASWTVTGSTLVIIYCHNTHKDIFKYKITLLTDSTLTLNHDLIYRRQN